MDSDHQFRNAPFGGFNKEDVLKYIEHLRGELVEFRENEGQRTQELEKSVAHLQSQLTTARNAVDMIKKNNDELKVQNESLKLQIVACEDRIASGKETSTAPKKEEKPIFSEQKTGGFVIEDSVITETEDSKFVKEDIEQYNEADYIDGLDNEKKGEETISEGEVDKQKNYDITNVNQNDLDVDEAIEEKEEEVDKESTQSDDVELFKNETEDFQKDYGQGDESAILKAQDSLRDLDIMLASAGFNFEEDSQESEKIEKDNEDEFLQEDDFSNDNNDEVMDRIAHHNQANKKDTEEKKDENKVSKLREFFDIDLSGISKTVEIDDDEVDKLVDKFTGEND